MAGRDRACRRGRDGEPQCGAVKRREGGGVPIHCLPLYSLWGSPCHRNLWFLELAVTCFPRVISMGKQIDPEMGDVNFTLSNMNR